MFGMAAMEYKNKQKAILFHNKIMSKIRNDYKSKKRTLKIISIDIEEDETGIMKKFFGSKKEKWKTVTMKILINNELPAEIKFYQFPNSIKYDKFELVEYLPFRFF